MKRRSGGAKWVARVCAAAAMLGAAASGWAQTAGGAAPAALAFDVISVRPSQAAAGNSDSNFPLGPGDVYAANGGNFVATGFPLIVYINFAYRVTPGQNPALRKHLPDWVLTERYDITAKSDKHDATKDEMRLMMRVLLAARFHLQIHSADEEQSVYALELVKPETLGPKLARHPAGEACAHTPQEADPKQVRPSIYEGEAVFPVYCGGVMGDGGKIPGTIALGARDVAMNLIASTIVGPAGLDRQVIDRTGLTGKFDFLLEFAPERSGMGGGDAGASGDVAGPGIAQALKEQLGMKLVGVKAPVQVWVADHVEHATAN